MDFNFYVGLVLMRLVTASAGISFAIYAYYSAHVDFTIAERENVLLVELAQQAKGRELVKIINQFVCGLSSVVAMYYGLILPPTFPFATISLAMMSLTMCWSSWKDYKLQRKWIT